MPNAMFVKLLMDNTAKPHKMNAFLKQIQVMAVHSLKIPNFLSLGLEPMPMEIICSLIQGGCPDSHNTQWEAFIKKPRH